MITYILSFSNAREKFLAAVGALAAIMMAIMAHEYAHGYVAKLNGDHTAALSGRLTFNPVKHFDIFGVLMFFIVGFGWAKPVPVNYNNFKNVKKGIVTVSLAGVTANLILVFASAAIFALLATVLSRFVISENSIGYMFLFLLIQFLTVSIIINIALIAFNMLPIFPLDGFRVIEAFSKPGNSFCNFMRRNGVYVLLGLIIVSYILGRISPSLNPLGIYLGFVRDQLFKLLALVFPSIF